MIARVAAVAALVAAIVVVVLVVLGGSTPYTLHADFQDAGGLVTGNDVLMGPAKVGTIQSISLTPNGQAQITMSDRLGRGAAARGHGGADLRELAVGSRDAVRRARAGPERRARHPERGTIGEDHTYGFVSLDQVFDSLDPLTLARAPRRHQGRGGEHPGPLRAGEQDAQVPRSRARQHQQPDRRARPQRAGVRRAARRGRADDAGARVAGAAAERPDRAGQHDDRRGGAPERRAAAGPPAPAEHAQPFDDHLRRARQHARRARSARGAVEDRFAPARAVRREPQHVHEGRDPHRHRAQRPDPQPSENRRPHHAVRRNPTSSQSSPPPRSRI